MLTPVPIAQIIGDIPASEYSDSVTLNLRFSFWCLAALWKTLLPWLPLIIEWDGSKLHCSRESKSLHHIAFVFHKSIYIYKIVFSASASGTWPCLGNFLEAG